MEKRTKAQQLWIFIQKILISTKKYHVFIELGALIFIESYQIYFFDNYFRCHLYL